MINLGSTGEEILREMDRYYQKALYWTRKYVARSEVRDIIDARLRYHLFASPPLRRLDAERDATSLDEPLPVTFYRPKGATPWVCSATIGVKDGAALVHPVCLAYYETVGGGGCGFFMPSFYQWTGYPAGPTGRVSHCTIVTSHCSLRWRDRMGLGGVQGTDLAISLALSMVGKGNSIHIVPNPKGKQTVIIKNRDGYFFGVFRMKDEKQFRTVVEMRTFLTSDMLSGRQRYMLSCIDKMEYINRADPLRLTDEELFRFWFYNGCTTPDELIGRILILRAICVIAQRIEKKMGRLLKERHAKVEKYNELFLLHSEEVERIGSTGILSGELRESIMTEAEFVCVRSFGINAEDNNLLASVVTIAEQTMQEIEELNYFPRRREQLLRQVGGWKDYQEMIQKKTDKMITSRQARKN